MFSLRNFWRRHRRNLLITAGILGSSYFLYKSYDAYKRNRANLERQLANEREQEELIRAQLQAHFESIQKIADTTTLPHAIQFLSSRIDEELDLSLITEKLMQGKGQTSTLTSSEKLELWRRLKVLSFTKIVASLWAMTMLSLYIRVQVNILGRHLYIDTARGLGTSDVLEDVDLIDRDDQQNFLASSDFLANYGIQPLISIIQAAVQEVVNGMELRDVFNTTAFQETIMRIIEMFTAVGNPHQWVYYLVPEDIRSSKLATDSSSHETDPVDTPKFQQLMMETRAVLSSSEFGTVAETSLKAVVDALVNDLGAQMTAGNLTTGVPLAKLLPQMVQVAKSLLEMPSQNRYVHIIQRVWEVELFFTLLYANMPATSR